MSIQSTVQLVPSSVSGKLAPYVTRLRSWNKEDEYKSNPLDRLGMFVATDLGSLHILPWMKNCSHRFGNISHK